MEVAVEDGLVLAPVLFVAWVGKLVLSAEKVRMRPDHMFETVEARGRRGELGAGLGGSSAAPGAGGWSVAEGIVLAVLAVLAAEACWEDRWLMPGRLSGEECD